MAYLELLLPRGEGGDTEFVAPLTLNTKNVAHPPNKIFFLKQSLAHQKKKKEKHRVAKVGPAHPAYLHPLIPSYTTAHNHHQQLQSPH